MAQTRSQAAAAAAAAAAVDTSQEGLELARALQAGLSLEEQEHSALQERQSLALLGTDTSRCLSVDSC
jgi:hypothetical protein